MPKIKTSKQEIIEKSYKVFKRRGYANTSISVLAKACDVQKAHFYYYFKNKEDIMREVLKYAYTMSKETILDLAFDESVEPQERLYKLLDNLRDFFGEVEIGCIMANTTIQTLHESTDFSPTVRLFCATTIDAIAHLYTERYSPKYAKGKAEQAFQDIQGGLILSQIYKDPRYLNDALKRVRKKL